MIVKKEKEMVNYANGKIYKIESINAIEGNDDIYIGSTSKQYLSQRMNKHRSDYNYWRKGKTKKTYSYGIFEKYGVDNCRIILLESFPCQSRDELTSREAFFIKSMGCVNKCIPQRTHSEYIEDNFEAIKQQRRDYRTANIETIAIHNREIIECQCGCTLSRAALSRHIKSPKHNTNMLLIESP